MNTDSKAKRAEFRKDLLEILSFALPATGVVIALSVGAFLTTIVLVHSG
jgi:hypothetical protein